VQLFFLNNAQEQEDIYIVYTMRIKKMSDERYQRLNIPTNTPTPPRSFSPLSPSCISFLKGALNSPTFPQILTPCRLDSPLTTPEGGRGLVSRTWGLATEDLRHNSSEILSTTINRQVGTLNEQLVQDGFDAGSWSNDLHAVLLQSAYTNPYLASHYPVLSSSSSSGKEPSLTAYNDDGESPENTDHEDEVSPKASTTNSSLRKRKSKRTFKEIANSASAAATAASLSFSYDQQVDHIPALTSADEADELVRAALLEDSKEAKTEAFPGLWEKAKHIIVTSAPDRDMESLAINALLSAFTNDDKTGRPLPRSCQDLLRKATDDVAAARKRQREGKTSKRTSLAQNQVDETFICNAPNCNKRYTTAEGLRLHIRNHHDVDKKWICHSPSCTAERAFVRQADLRMHLIRMHSPVRPFPCRVPNCSKNFACHSELRRHIATEHPDLVRSILRETCD
jgi:hypothetical protein